MLICNNVFQFHFPLVASVRSRLEEWNDERGRKKKVEERWIEGETKGKKRDSAAVHWKGGAGKPRVREPVSFRSCCQRRRALRLHSLFVRRHPPLSRGRGEEGGSNERSLLGRALRRTRRVDLHPLCVISLRY